MMPKGSVSLSSELIFHADVAALQFVLHLRCSILPEAACSCNRLRTPPANDLVEHGFCCWRCTWEREGVINTGPSSSVPATVRLNTGRPLLFSLAYIEYRFPHLQSWRTNLLCDFFLRWFKVFKYLSLTHRAQISAMRFSQLSDLSTCCDSVNLSCKNNWITPGLESLHLLL